MIINNYFKIYDNIKIKYKIKILKFVLQWIIKLKIIINLNYT